MEEVGCLTPGWHPGLRRRTHLFISSTKSASGLNRAFNLFIITLILLNVTAMILESIERVRTLVPGWFLGFEYFSVAVFSLEYVLRIWSCVEEPPYSRPVFGRLRFALTPLALVDLLAVLPFYLPYLSVDLRVLRMFRMVRIMRVMRIMRIAKLGRYSESVQTLLRVLYAKREQLLSTVFILGILLVVSASLMYYAERDAQPKSFSSIPAAMWWAVATLTTVGYGDIYPVTAIGKLMASVIAVLGIGLGALPTGILGAGFIEEMQNRKKPRQCPHCGKDLTD